MLSPFFSNPIKIQAMKKYVLINLINYYLTLIIDGKEVNIQFAGGISNATVRRPGFFKTDDKVLQDAIESHKSYGVVFQLAPGFKMNKPKKEEETPEPPANTNPDTEPPVTSDAPPSDESPETDADNDTHPLVDHPEFTAFQEARDYFIGLGIEGVTLEGIRSKKALVEIAKEKGHSFSSLKL